MKKTNVLSTMLLTAMLLSGCSSNAGSVDFSNLKVKDISQYSALGYRTKSKNGNANKKSRNNIKRAIFNKDESKYVFTITEENGSLDFK